MDFSIVIPCYNRLENLKLVLAGIHAQVNPPDYQVIIADDGSTDGTVEFLNNYVHHVHYIWCGPHQGFRPHRTRNIGVTQAVGRWVIFLDSDVILNPHALEEHAKLREKFPDIVVIGMYHFAMPGHLTQNMIVDDYEKNVMGLVPSSLSQGPPQPGIDCRVNGFTDELSEDKIITHYDGLGFFGGNTSWPVDLFWEIGGYDEKMPSGMGEDAELGQRMRGSIDGELVRQPVPVLQYAPIYGVHIHHDRDWEESRQLVQKSIFYIDKKYGIGQFARNTRPETDPRQKDLYLWYQKEMKAILVRLQDEYTVYAVSEDGMYVGLPVPEWISELGFTPSDVKSVDKEFLEGKSYQGTITK